MINQEGATPVQAKRTYVGPLAPYIDGFVLFLLREGYSPVSVNEKRYVITDLSRWMERRKLPLARLNEEQLTHFRISRQRRGRQQRGAMWAADQLLRYLRDLGCISLPRKKIDRTALGQLIQDFERYLSAERGLSRSTLVDYPLIARRFLSDRFGNNSVRVTVKRCDRATFIALLFATSRPAVAVKPNGWLVLCALSCAFYISAIKLRSI
jgi:hypothetical protein